MIAELLLAIAFKLAIELSGKDRTRRAYEEADKINRSEVAQRLEEAYYDSLRQHYDSLDIK